jgi:hypothetical protein
MQGTVGEELLSGFDYSFLPHLGLGEFGFGQLMRGFCGAKSRNDYGYEKLEQGDSEQ